MRVNILENPYSVYVLPQVWRAGVREQPALRGLKKNIIPLSFLPVLVLPKEKLEGMACSLGSKWRDASFRVTMLKVPYSGPEGKKIILICILLSTRGLSY